ncbi:CYTH domain-containing protein [Candidatus Roizmanbacteria bacterium]|nr:CYTH domain-containing protein [Candidatus Roizmanbacteria bacterium]
MSLKERKDKPGIEIEYKLALPYSIENARGALDELGLERTERINELTVMYDNASKIMPSQVGILYVTYSNNVATLAYAELNNRIGDIDDLEEFALILDKLGFEESDNDTGKMFSLRTDITPTFMETTDSRLRLRTKTLPNGESTHILSYKKPLTREGIKREIEHESAITNGRGVDGLLNSLGFHPVSSYERFRTSWLDCKQGVHLDLDEFPFGNYIEVEGNNIQALEKYIRQLGLDKNAHLTRSYDGIYYDLEKSKGNFSPNTHIRF